MSSITRFRRMRMTEPLRSMMRETHLHREDLIYPLFVVTGNKIRTEVKSMPGVYQLSIDETVRECVSVRTGHSCSDTLRNPGAQR